MHFASTLAVLPNLIVCRTHIFVLKLPSSALSSLLVQCLTAHVRCAAAGKPHAPCALCLGLGSDQCRLRLPAFFWRHSVRGVAVVSHLDCAEMEGLSPLHIFLYKTRTCLVLFGPCRACALSTAQDETASTPH